MRILYLVGGNDFPAGGATVRDAAFVRAMRQAGHEVDAVALFSPTGVEGTPDTEGIFTHLGRSTLRRLFPQLTRASRTIVSMINNPRQMNMTGMGGVRLDPRGMLAVGMLAGTDKTQAREYGRIREYTARHTARVDACFLANALLSGLAPQLKLEFGCPIICLSQDSAHLLDSLEEPHQSVARKLMRKNARHFALLVTTNRWSAVADAETLALPAARIRIISPAVDCTGLQAAPQRVRDPFTIGFLAPLCREKGADIVVDAVESLITAARVDARLRIAGPHVDEHYVRRLHHLLERPVFDGRWEIMSQPTGADRTAFFQSLSVFVNASREPETRAVGIIEALASGVPVVGPASGIVPEILQSTRGGVVVPLDAPPWMYTQAFEVLAADPEAADHLGQLGSEGVRKHFSIDAAAVSLQQLLDEAAAMERSA